MGGLTSGWPEFQTDVDSRLLGKFSKSYKNQNTFTCSMYKFLSQAREQRDDPGQRAGHVPPPRRLRLPPHHVLLL